VPQSGLAVLRQTAVWGLSLNQGYRIGSFEDQNPPLRGEVAPAWGSEGWPHLQMGCRKSGHFLTG
jgi:hypothetical protein